MTASLVITASPAALGLRACAAALALAAAATPLCAQGPGQALLARRYREGDSLHYVMNATNQGRTGTITYGARADGVVRKDSLGRIVEDFEWSHLVRDGHDVPLAAGTDAVRQQLTLSPGFMVPPNVARTDPRLVGPVLDLLTFYVDLWLAAKMPLAHAGDHAHLPRTAPNSWADGRVVILGADAIDFDITLVSLDSAAGRARLLVRHVPPAKAVVHFPASWMQVPLFDTPNNWVEVTKTSDTSYLAGAGRETFDVEIDVSLADGRIVAATMDNPVDLVERVCRDAALTVCAPPYRYRILRRIALHSR
jgi:hypothetical protein